MDNATMQQLVDAVVGSLFVELEASGRHVHVTKEQALTLFGHPLTSKRPLSQPGSTWPTNGWRWLAPREHLTTWQCLARNGRQDRWKSL